MQIKLESGFNPIFCLRIIQVSLKAENIGNVVGDIRCPIVLLSHLIFKKTTLKKKHNISDQ
jgi:hypothetical protein